MNKSDLVFTYCYCYHFGGSKSQLCISLFCNKNTYEHIETLFAILMSLILYVSIAVHHSIIFSSIIPSYLFILLMLYDGKYPFNNIISFIFYIITNFSLLNSCCLLLQDHNVDQLLVLLLFQTQYKYSSSYILVPQFID